MNFSIRASSRQLPLLRILVVGFDESRTQFLLDHVRSVYDVHYQVAHGSEQMSDALRNTPFDVIIAFWEPSHFELATELAPTIPFIAIADRIDEVEAVAAIRAGVYDFMTSVRLFLLAPAIERALRDTARQRKQPVVSDEQRLLKTIELQTAELDAILESMPDAIYIGTAEGITRCNTKALKMLGASSLEDLQARIGELGQKFRVRWPDSGRLLRPEELQFSRALNGETVVEEVLATNAETGTDVYIRSACAPIVEDGKVVAAVAINSDITDKKQAERALRESELHLSLAIEGTGLASWDVDLVTGTTIWSDGLFRMLGYSPSATVASYEKWVKALHIEDRERVLKTIEEAKQSRQTYTAEYRIVQFGTNAVCWQQATGRFLYDLKTGAPVRFLGIVTDTTERKRAEQALRESEERFAAAFRASPDALIISDMRTGLILDVNDSWVRCWGYSWEESVGQPSTELGIFESVEDRERAVQLVRDRGSLRDFEVAVRHKSGELRHASISSEVLRLNGRQLMLTIMRDVTDSKRAEEERHRLTQEIERRAAESEEGRRLLEGLLEHLNEGIGITGGPPDFPLLKVSRYGLDISGRPAETLTGMPSGYHQTAWDILLPDGVTRPSPEQMPLYRATRHGETVKDIELIIRRADGRDISVLVNAAPIRDAQGNIVAGINAWRDITERKRAEEALREARARIDEVVASIQDVFYMVDANWRFVYVNDAALSMWNKTREELIGNDIWKVFPQGVETYAYEQMQRAMQERTPLHFETRSPFIGRWVDVHAFPTESGGLTVYFADITERKRAEEALRQSEDRFAAAFQASPGGLVISEVDTGIMIDVNDTWVRQWGYSREETIGRRSADIGILDNLSDREHLVRELRTHGRVRNLELPFRRKSGELRYAELSAEILHLSERQLMLTIVQDVTERKRTEEALRQAYARTDEVVASIQEVFYMLDADWRFVYVNDQALNVWKKTREELIGRTIWEVFPEAVNTHASNELRRAMAERIAVNYETFSPILHRWINVQVFPTQSGGVTVYFTDITAHKEAVEELHRSRSLLAEAEKLSHTGAWEWNLTTNRWTFSDAWLAIHGCDNRTLTPDELLTIAHPDDRATVARALEDVQSGRAAYDIEHRIVRLNDGEVRTVRARGRYARDESGNVVRVYGFAQDITDRKKADEALRLSEERLRATFNYAGVGIVEVDRDDRFIAVNDHICHMLGYSRTELLGKTVHDITASQDRVQSDTLNADLHTGRRNQIDYEKRYLKRDGTPVWVHVIVSAIRDSEGRWLRSIATIEDINERKRTEEALRESEERFRTAFENAPLGFYRTTPDGQILLCNDALLKMLRFSSFEELAARNLEREGFSSRRARHEFIAQIEKHGYVRGIESEWTRRDGTTICVRESARAVRDDNGRILYFDGIAEDVTERNLVEEIRQRSETILKEAGQMAHLGAWEIEIVDAQNLNVNSLYWSDEVYRMFGYEPGTVEVSNDLFFNHVHPDDRQRVAQAVEEAIRSRRTYSLEHRIVRTDGTERTVLERGEIFFDSSGLPARIVGAVQDITERKQAEKRLETLNATLEQRVEERTAQLRAEVDERKRAEEHLRKTAEQLEQERQALERKNIAMREILSSVESHKSDIKQRIATNVEQTITPTLQRLKESVQPPLARLVDALERDLDQITSPFVTLLRSSEVNLSPRELEICRMIRIGANSKEIAETLNLSIMTIQKHREAIRKKLGLTNSETNLETYLQSLGEI